jgi:hypothetical protein
MLVEIVDTSTSSVICSYKIVVGDYARPVSEKDYFDEAWRNALEDRLVSESQKPKYAFRLVR